MPPRDPHTTMPPEVTARRKLQVALVVTVGFAGLEVAGGVYSGSLALCSDAAHILTDAGSFGIALAASMMVERSATASYTFGFARVEILGALASTLAIWLLTGALLAETAHRLAQPPDTTAPVDGKTMVVLGVASLAMNVFLAQVLGAHSHGLPGEECNHAGHAHAGHEHGDACGHAKALDEVEAAAAPGAGWANVHKAGETTALLGGGTARPRRNLNIDSAYLHVLGDMIQSVGVILAGGLIWRKPEWQIADPLLTIVFALLVMWSTFPMMKTITNILLQGAPEVRPFSREEKNRPPPPPFVLSMIIQLCNLCLLSTELQCRYLLHFMSAAKRTAQLCFRARRDMQRLTLNPPSYYFFSQVVNAPALLDKLRSIPGATDVHALHIWSLSAARTVATVHVACERGTSAGVLRAANRVFQDVGVDLATVQVYEGDECTSLAHVV